MALAVGLVGGVTVVATLIWGGTGAVAAAWMGALASVIHLFAARGIRQVWDKGFKHVYGRFAVGMLMRLAGAFVMFFVVIRRPEIFPPLPSAAGYLMVLIPLLFMEIRFLR